jgi:hypothetical protein
MTVDRMARAIMAFHKVIAPLTGVEPMVSDETAQLNAIKVALVHEHPDIQPMVMAVNAVVNAYLGDDIEAMARHIINTVAAGGKVKRIDMNVVEGPNIGPWQIIVRPNREPQTPAIVREPGRVTKLILPGRH